MAKSKALESAHDTIKDVHNIADEAGPTRREMESALEQIINLCVEELPELEPEEEEEAEGDEEEEEEEDEE